ncbi:MAG: nucleoside/nucleotide kinase family protein [Ilumatobacter sp.]|uniref:nucleoside/nucleotide kinase family protein n=1 Tax=Ilumatobacter sp. TaxID=1967498 RepID=UPI003C756B24
MATTLNANGLAAWIGDQAAGSDRFLVGIAGAPGSGKSTLAAQLAGELDAVLVAMDGFHLSNAELDRRGVRCIKGAPQTFDADGFVAAVRALRRAESDLSLPDFDRDLDEPRQDRVRVPASARIVIIEGNYLLLGAAPWVELRRLLDAVAHLDIDTAVRVRRLIERHVRFGRTPDEAAAFVHASDEPNAALVEAARHRAHLIVKRADVAEPEDADRVD